MRALLVDDQVWLRSALRLLLEDEANVKVVGETGSLATLPALVAELNPDLLFLDWQLTGLNTNGARLCTIRSVRAEKPDLYIIAVTDDPTPAECLRWGADALINRAGPPDNVMATIRLAAAKWAMARQPHNDDYHLH